MKKILLILICASALLAQTHNVNSDTSIASINGVDTANIASINGVNWLGFPTGGGVTPFATLDFEEGDLTDFSNTGSGADTSKTYVQAGTYSMKYTASNTFCNITFTAKSTVFAVFYIYISSTVTVATGGNLYTAYFGSGGTDYTMLAMDWDEGSTNLIHSWLLGWNNSNLSVEDFDNFDRGQWKKIKMQYTQGTGADAIHKIWVDDVLLLNITNGTSTSTIDNLRITTEAWTSASPIYFIDNINLYDEDPDG